ncbi:MAG: GGDEF domain-containing protein [Chloroflexi bacterium]|uniref:Bifunctional diguanylate cyclase/phosphodiesterase n=1 Tax=Candidatus Chlorohelix allophototropha TaxID=3003348 RepID=A0A8T7LZU1_9CHLR|nr:GGDEF domain-containing protein [Chloroflexota bacterium]WJW66013.1 bifunctional diguanylate cyclase/phosphodiesterase [Chloroflexota bacterium L227-S17]
MKKILDPVTMEEAARRSGFLSKVGNSLDNPHVKEPLAIIYINIDFFRLANIELGYINGNQLISDIFRRLISCFGIDEFVEHLYFDNFVAFIADGSRTLTLIEKIQEELARPFTVKGKAISVSATMGVAVSQKKELETPEELLRNAEIAMFYARSHGRGNFEIYQTEIRTNFTQRFEMELELRRAIFNNEFLVYYQPIVAFGSNEFKGFEALARWKHPTRGILTATQFLEVAEEAKLLEAISYTVLKRACNQTREWKAKFGLYPMLSVSVNLSTGQILDPNLVMEVEKALIQTGLEAFSLHLEISEDSLMVNPELAARQLLNLKVLGVKAVLDGFGIGKSSLGWLSRFQLDEIKFDRSFLYQLLENRKTIALAESVVNTARNLGMKVVVKGIETEEQVKKFGNLKFDYFQGNFLSFPLSAEDSNNWLETQVSARSK